MLQNKVRLAGHYGEALVFENLLNSPMGNVPAKKSTLHCFTSLSKVSSWEVVVAQVVERWFLSGQAGFKSRDGFWLFSGLNCCQSILTGCF